MGPLPHLQLRRVLIHLGLDTDDQVHVHEAGTPVSCPSDIPYTHDIFSYLHSQAETMDYGIGHLSSW